MVSLNDGTSDFTATIDNTHACTANSAELPRALVVLHSLKQLLKTKPGQLEKLAVQVMRVLMDAGQVLAAAQCAWVTVRSCCLPKSVAPAPRGSALQSSKVVNCSDKQGSIAEAWCGQAWDDVSALCARALRQIGKLQGHPESERLRRLGEGCLALLASTGASSDVHSAAMSHLVPLIAGSIAASHPKLPKPAVATLATWHAAAAASDACMSGALAALTRASREEDALLAGQGSQADFAAACAAAFACTRRGLATLAGCPALPQREEVSGASASILQAGLAHGACIESLHKMLAFWEARPLVGVGLWAPEAYAAWLQGAEPGASSAGSGTTVSPTGTEEGVLAALATPAPPTVVRAQYMWPPSAAPATGGRSSATTTPCRSATATPGRSFASRAPKTPAALRRVAAATPAFAAPTDSRRGTGTTGKDADPTQNWWSLLEKGFAIALKLQSSVRSALGTPIASRALQPGHGLPSACEALVQGGGGGDPALPLSRVLPDAAAAFKVHSDRSMRQLSVNEAESGLGAALARMARMRLCAGQSVHCSFAGQVEEEEEEAVVDVAGVEGGSDATAHHLQKAMQYLCRAASSAACAGGSSGFDCAATIATAAHNVSKALYDGGHFAQASVPLSVAAHAVRLCALSGLAAGQCDASRRTLLRSTVSKQYTSLATCLHKAVLDGAGKPLPSQAVTAAGLAFAWRCAEAGAGAAASLASPSQRLVRVACDALVGCEQADTLEAPAPKPLAGKFVDVCSWSSTGLSAADISALSMLAVLTHQPGQAPPASTASSLAALPRQAFEAVQSLGVAAEGHTPSGGEALASAAVHQISRVSGALGTWSAPHDVTAALNETLKVGGGCEKGGQTRTPPPTMVKAVQRALTAAATDASMRQARLCEAIALATKKPGIAGRVRQILWHTSTRLSAGVLATQGGALPAWLRRGDTGTILSEVDHSVTGGAEASVQGSSTSLSPRTVGALPTLQWLLRAPAAFVPCTAGAAVAGQDPGASRMALLLPRLYAASSIAMTAPWSPDTLADAVKLESACLASLASVDGGKAVGHMWWAAAMCQPDQLALVGEDSLPAGGVRWVLAAADAAVDAANSGELPRAVQSACSAIAGWMMLPSAASQASCLPMVQRLVAAAREGGQAATESGCGLHLLPALVAVLAYFAARYVSREVLAAAEPVLQAACGACEAAASRQARGGGTPTRRIQFGTADGGVAPPLQHATPAEAGPGMAPVDDDTARRLFDMVDIDEGEDVEGGAGAARPSRVALPATTPGRECRASSPAGRVLRFADTTEEHQPAPATCRRRVRGAVRFAGTPAQSPDSPALCESPCTSLTPLVQVLKQSFAWLKGPVAEGWPPSIVAEARATCLARLWSTLHSTSAMLGDATGSCPLSSPWLHTLALHRALLCASATLAQVGCSTAAETYAVKALQLGHACPSVDMNARAVQALTLARAARGKAVLSSGAKVPERLHQLPVAASAVAVAEAAVLSFRWAPAAAHAKAAIAALVEHLKAPDSLDGLRALELWGASAQVLLAVGLKAGPRVSGLDEEVASALGRALLQRDMPNADAAALAAALDLPRGAEDALQRAACAWQPAAAPTCPVLRHPLPAVLTLLGTGSASWGSDSAPWDGAICQATFEAGIEGSTADLECETECASVGAGAGVSVPVEVMAGSLKAALLLAWRRGDCLATQHLAQALAAAVGRADGPLTYGCLVLACGAVADHTLARMLVRRELPAAAEWTQCILTEPEALVVSPAAVEVDDGTMRVALLGAADVCAVSTPSGCGVMLASGVEGPTLAMLDTRSSRGGHVTALPAMYKQWLPTEAGLVCTALKEVGEALQQSRESVVSSGLTSAAAASAVSWTPAQRARWWKERQRIDEQLVTAVQVLAQPLADVLEDMLPRNSDWRADGGSAASPADVSAPLYSAEDIAAMRVVDLREALAELKLPTKGRKAELQERLSEAMATAPAPESIAGTVQTCPSFTIMLCPVLQHIPFEAVWAGRDWMVSRLPCAAAATLTALAPGAVTQLSGGHCVNPGEDLPGTQEALAPVLDAIASRPGAAWKATAGSSAAAQYMATAASGHVFVYAGHGSGEAYAPAALLGRSLNPAPVVALLMGCSSGRLRVEGVGGPAGAALAFLCAGSTAVAGNLWDVTGGDEDRFAEAILKAWLLGDRDCLVQAIQGSRVVCKLPNLTGGSLVVYGRHVRRALGSG